MATIVNATPNSTDRGSGLGFLLGVLLLIIFGVLFVYYLAPGLTRGFMGAGTPSIQVPGKIDVNVNK
jgi:hypothetical protein